MIDLSELLLHLLLRLPLLLHVVVDSCRHLHHVVDHGGELSGLLVVVSLGLGELALGLPVAPVEEAVEDEQNDPDHVEGQGPLGSTQRYIALFHVNWDLAPDVAPCSHVWWFGIIT